MHCCVPEVNKLKVYLNKDSSWKGQLTALDSGLWRRKSSFFTNEVWKNEGLVIVSIFLIPCLNATLLPTMIQISQYVSDTVSPSARPKIEGSEERKPSAAESYLQYTVSPSARQKMECACLCGGSRCARGGTRIIPLGLFEETRFSCIGLAASQKTYTRRGHWYMIMSWHFDFVLFSNRGHWDIR